MLRLGSKRTKAQKCVAALSEIANTETVVHTAHSLVLTVLPLNLLLFDKYVDPPKLLLKEVTDFLPAIMV